MLLNYSIIKNLPLIGISFISIGVIIGFHELGHFLFCKLFRVKTPSFSIGFGPRLISKKIGETLFSLSLIPFGGYVEIAGMQEVGQGEQKDALRSDDLSFNTKPYYQKLLILSGGILFNLLMSYLLLVGLCYLGAPKTPMLHANEIAPKIGQITNGSAAEKAGLKAGDLFIEFNHQPVKTALELHQLISTHPNQSIEFTVERQGAPLQISCLIDSNNKSGQIGIQFAPVFAAPLPLIQSLKESFNIAHNLLVKIALQFKSLFQQRSLQSIGGPVMIISEMTNSAKYGPRILIFFLVIISLNLAVLNLIPVPILDGGQILFTTIESLIGRAIPDTIKLTIHYICWFGAIALAIYLSYKDLFKIFFK